MSSTGDLPFNCEKRPAEGAQGMVVTNSPVGSAAGAEMLASGGNAVDAAVAALLTLTVVEPMMVGIVGGGLAHLRLADGRHVIVDALSCAGEAMHPTMFDPDPAAPAFSHRALGDHNTNGPSAVAVPGNLAGWALMHRRYGRLPFADVIEPAIRAAARGFTASAYLQGAVTENAAVLAQDPGMAALFLPGGAPIRAGTRVTMGDYAESLRLIQSEGAAALHGGALGQALIAGMDTGGPDRGLLAMADLTGYRPLEREPIRGIYRGHEVLGPPPPASSGVHVVEMLNILGHWDLGAMSFASPERLHLLIEAMRVGFADRRAASGDPDFVDVPVGIYTSAAHAAAAAARIRAGLSGKAPAIPGPHESRDTTHVTVADGGGMIVSATHTINGLFGARYMVPGTGMIPNNYMQNFDPAPGRARSVQPGKRVPTSMAPMILCRDGRPVFALGLPGGVRIFPSAMQAIVNLLDHGMTLQQAVEAPRIWTEGAHVELEPALAAAASPLAMLGHEARTVPTIGGGMNAIAFGTDGMMTGAACWRADGFAIGLGGGLARPGVRFHL